MSGDGTALRSLDGASLAARLLLFLQAIVSLAAAAAGHVLGHDFDGSGDSPVYSALSALQILVFLAGAIAFFVWLHRAVANVHALGARGFHTGPTMAIAWYFIPLANLAMPYATMRDTWKASTDPRDWEAARGSAAIGWWWLFWLVGNIAGIIVLRLVAGGEFDEVEAIGAPLSTVSDVCTAVASVLLALIIGWISAKQALPETVPEPARISSN